MNVLYKHFNNLPYELMIENKTKTEAKNFAKQIRQELTATLHGKRVRVIPDAYNKGKWCVYALMGAKKLMHGVSLRKLR